MTFIEQPMNQEEWDQLLAIRKEMNANLMAHDARMQERYTELLVESLRGKGDGPVRTVPPTLPTDGPTVE
jgi:hypothetical protein